MLCAKIARLMKNTGKLCKMRGVRFDELKRHRAIKKRLSDEVFLALEIDAKPLNRSGSCT